MANPFEGKTSTTGGKAGLAAFGELQTNKTYDDETLKSNPGAPLPGPVEGTTQEYLDQRNGINRPDYEAQELQKFKDIKKTYPEKCSYCNFCDWSEQCNNEWIQKRDINQVLGNNRKDCQKFRKSGLKTYDDIAKLDPKKTIEGLREEIKIKRIFYLDKSIKT